VDPAKMPARVPRGPEAPFVVGFAGSLKQWHGIEVLVDACRRALSLVPDLRIEILGRGPLASQLAVIESDARVFVYGQTTHASALSLMTQWDVGLAPYLPLSDFYFSPLKVVEYMAAGACPVASDLGQIRPLLGAGSRGVLVEPGNGRALAAAIVDLACDPARASALGERAARYVLSSRTWSQNARRALQALHGRPSEAGG